MKLTVLFPVLTALLIAGFYLFLPPLQACRLPRSRIKSAGGAARRGERAAVALVTLLYALAAFSHLGDRTGPQSALVFSEGESLTLELDGSYELSRAMVYSVLGTGGFSFSLSEDGETWSDAAALDQNYVALLKWHELTLFGRARYLRLTPYGSPELGELTLYDTSGSALPWKTRNALTDEQALTPERPSFPRGKRRQ